MVIAITMAVTTTKQSYQAFAKDTNSGVVPSSEKNVKDTPVSDNGATAIIDQNHVAIIGIRHAKSFSPNPIDIRVGDTVTWTNDHREGHTVTSKASEFDSGDIRPGQSFSHTFDKAGSFEYFCEIHPSMVGKVNVS